MPEALFRPVLLGPEISTNVSKEVGGRGEVAAF